MLNQQIQIQGNNFIDRIDIFISQFMQGNKIQFDLTMLKDMVKLLKEVKKTKKKTSHII